MDIVCVEPKVWLQEEFNKRRSRNSNYSLRAFANYLKIPPGRLSQILSSKRELTTKLGEKISDRLGFDPETKQRFLQSIISRRTNNKNFRFSDSLYKQKVNEDDYQLIDMDNFYLIADRYHFALLSLMQTIDFRNDIKWISKRLSISVIQVRAAIERLQRLSLIKKLNNGKIILSTIKNLTTSHNVSSTALRKSHHQALEKAKLSLDHDPIEIRDFTSITMAIDPEKIPQAKEMIKIFRRKLCKFLESGNKRQVYDLNIQLLPATTINNEENKQ